MQPFRAGAQSLEVKLVSLVKLLDQTIKGNSIYSFKFSGPYISEFSGDWIGERVVR